MLDSIESAIEAIKNGQLVIVVDDEDRENEGDFITAAENVTPEIINFMSTYGRGLIYFFACYSFHGKYRLVGARLYHRDFCS